MASRIAMNELRRLVQRVNTTVVVGVALLFLHAFVLIVLQSTVATSASPQAVIALVSIGFAISVVIAVFGIMIARWQSRARLRRLRRANDLLNRVAASLSATGPVTESPNLIEMDAYVERLAQLVDEVQRVVDERQQREREVMRADQLAMVGQMAAGVAHELRNPLTSIKMLVQTAQKPGSPGLTDDDLAMIEHEIRRLEKSLQRFLDFARPPRPERRPLHLITVVERALALIEGRARKQRVRLSFVPPAEPIVVKADEDQIQQLLLNLLLNSLDVMAEGGALTVELAGAPGNHAELRVRDTGPGIPSELLSRLFDPFMSTKETGIGLGLAVSHRIAESHGGTLSAENQPGRGACFVLRLMRAQEV
jgi:two-component system sensor histidine kinase HydH